MELKKLHEYNLLTHNIIFADGLTRTGKAMLNNLLLGFEKTSSIQFINILEQLLPMYEAGEMSKNALSAYLRLHLNENFYNYKLSRNLNFRYDDLTSIYNTKNSTDFLKNLAKQDGAEIIDEFKDDDTFYQFQTHDLLTHYSSFLDLDIDIYLIELFRNPIDTVHSWYLRGWGTRFDTVDPRSFTTLFNYKEHTISHYAIGCEDEYLSLNPMEKCIFMHNNLLKKSLNEYKKTTTKQKQKIHLVKYEDLLTNPSQELKKISKFLNLPISPYMDMAMKDARVPREIESKKTEIKLEEITLKAKPSLVNELVEMTNMYKTHFYGLT